MSNMSYCRWQNTCGDLQDCIRSLYEGDELSTDEKAYAIKTIRLMAEALAEIGIAFEFPLDEAPARAEAAFNEYCTEEQI